MLSLWQRTIATVSNAHFPDPRARHAGELLRAARARRYAQARRGAAQHSRQGAGRARRWPRPRRAARSSCRTARRRARRSFLPLAPDCCAFLRVAVDIRNIDVDAASAQGVLVTRATPGFMASVVRNGDRHDDRLRRARSPTRSSSIATAAKPSRARACSFTAQRSASWAMARSRGILRRSASRSA